MKLLDLLVKEGLEWPEGAQYAAQGYNRVVYFYRKPPFQAYDSSDSDVPVLFGYQSTIYCDTLAGDYSTKEVTKGEYLEAVALSEKVNVEEENLSTLTNKYQRQKSLERALENVSKDYKQAADETLAKINALLESVSLEVVESVDLVDLSSLMDGDIVEFVGYSDDTLKHWKFTAGNKYLVSGGGFLRDDDGDKFHRYCYEGFMFKYVGKA